MAARLTISEDLQRLLAAACLRGLGINQLLQIDGRELVPLLLWAGFDNGYNVVDEPRAERAFAELYQLHVTTRDEAVTWLRRNTQ